MPSCVSHLFIFLFIEKYNAWIFSLYSNSSLWLGSKTGIPVVVLYNFTSFVVFIYDILPPNDRFTNFKGISASVFIEKLFTFWLPLFIAE